MVAPKQDDKSIALQKNYTSLKDVLEKNKGKIEKILPKAISPEKLLEITLFNVRLNPKLMECDLASLIGAVAQGAMLGIIPGDGTRKGDLIPYFNGKKQRMECSFQPRYGGLIHIAKNGNPNEWGHAEKVTVHAKDIFEFEKGTKPFIKHIPSKDQDPGEPTHFYSVVFLKDGTSIFEVITKKEADTFRDRSKAKDSGPWVTDYEEMAEIRPLKRVLKLLPWESERLHKALDLAEKVEAGESQGNVELINENELGSVIEAEVVKDPDPGPTPKLGAPIAKPTEDEAATKEKLKKQANALIIADIQDFTDPDELTAWWAKQPESHKNDQELMTAFGTKWNALKKK